MADDRRVYLFDSTLRDGAQTQGVDFTVPDKLAIARALDRLGVDYVEGGWPGANPTDDAFFGEPPEFAVSRLVRSEEHTSELQSLMRISYAVFCLKKKKKAKRA